MGIRSLYPLLKKRAQEAVRALQLGEFRGRAATLDGNNFVRKFAHLRGACSDATLPAICDDLARVGNFVRSYGLRLLILFDGPNAVPEKAVTNHERAQRRAQGRQRLVPLRSELGVLRAALPPQAPPAPFPAVLASAGESPSAEATEAGSNVPEEGKDEKRAEGPVIAPRPIAAPAPAPVSAPAARAQEDKDGDVAMTEEERVAVRVPVSADAVLDESLLPLSARVDPDSVEAEVLRLEDRVTSLEKQGIVVTQPQLARIAETLAQRGFACVLAPSESDFVTGHLARAGVVDIAFGDDSDALPFGARFVCRNLHRYMLGADPALEVFDRARALALLKLTEAQFVDLCILMHCDYASTIRNVGPMTALSALRAHGSIERLIRRLPCHLVEPPSSSSDSSSSDSDNTDEEKPERKRGPARRGKRRYEYGPGFLEEVRRARELFLRPPCPAPLVAECRDKLSRLVLPDPSSSPIPRSSAFSSSAAGAQRAPFEYTPPPLSTPCPFLR